MRWPFPLPLLSLVACGAKHRLVDDAGLTPLCMVGEDLLSDEVFDGFSEQLVLGLVNRSLHEV